MDTDPIFLLGAHKSGTSLLRSLLDNHPKLFVVPFENHFFEYSGFWTAYHLRGTKPKTLTPEEIINNFYDHLERNQTQKDSMGGGVPIENLDLQIYSESMKELNPNSLKMIILSHIKSVYKAIYKTNYNENLRFVEKSITHTEYALDLKEMFPHAKFIHILRNPYSNVVSLRNYFDTNNHLKYPFLFPILDSLKNSYYFLHRNKDLLHDDYLIIRYEDLLKNTKGTMEIITEFLNIEFTDTLLSPTVLGEQWLGNSSKRIKQYGVNKSNLEYWEKEITHLEIYYVNLFLDFMLKENDYQILKPKKSLWRRTKGESMKFYLLNRLMKYY